MKCHEEPDYRATRTAFVVSRGTRLSCHANRRGLRRRTRLSCYCWP